MLQTYNLAGTVIYYDSDKKVIARYPSKSNLLLTQPKVLSEGFVYSGNVLKKYEKELKRVIEQLLPKKLPTQLLKDSLVSYFIKYFEKNNGTEPMIIPQIVYQN